MSYLLWTDGKVASIASRRFPQERRAAEHRHRNGARGRDLEVGEGALRARHLPRGAPASDALPYPLCRRSRPRLRKVGLTPQPDLLGEG